jgi:misacylated tRNA(Ala) deacylase
MIENQKQYHPPMHTAEHILNQTMNRMFNCGRAFSSHIERKKSKCDYHIDRALTDDEVKAVENKVNEIIGLNLNVTEEYISLEEGQKYFNLSRLPDDAGETLRIIRVGDYDSCPCSGLHVSNTSEIGTFSISSASFENGFVRLRFKVSQTSEG